MVKFINFSSFILIFLLITLKTFALEKNQISEDTIKFNVVEKAISFDESLPNEFIENLSKWFENRVKVSGFEGDVFFEFFDYTHNTEIIDDGKKIILSLSFSVTAKNNTLSNKKIFKGKVSNYGNIQGSFSLNDFDVLIHNTQNQLINNFAKNIKGKF